MIEEVQSEERHESQDQANENIVEEIITENENEYVSKKPEKKKESTTKSTDEYVFTQNFFDNLEKKYESLATRDNDNAEEALDPNSVSSHSDDESNDEMDIDNHYNNLKKNINSYTFPKDFFFTPAYKTNFAETFQQQQQQPTISPSNENLDRLFHGNRDGNFEFEEEISDVPESQEDQINADKRREILNNRLLESGIDLDSENITNNSSYSFMIKQYLKGIIFFFHIFKIKRRFLFYIHIH